MPKSQQKILMISTPVVNFINVKCANFTYKSLFSSYVLALNELSYEKFVRKMLMKLTLGVKIINILRESFFLTMVFFTAFPFVSEIFCAKGNQ